MAITDQQLRSNDCGISAIKTIYNLLGKDIDRNYIQNQVFVEERGASISDIKKFFDAQGCTAYYKFLDIQSLSQDLSVLKGLFPFILPVRRGNNLHYLVANGLKGNKIRIYDPATIKASTLTLAELRSAAHYADTYWELAEVNDRIGLLSAQELSRYNISLEGLLSSQDYPTIFNKLVYFAHIRDSFGFKDEPAEKAFLEDLLYNQQLSWLPKQYRQLKYEQDKIKLSAPLILSVKAIPDQTVSPKAPVTETNVYVRLLRELGANKRIWYIYLLTALFAASISQLTVFVNQILIDHVLPSFQLHILTLFALGLGLFKLFDLLISQYKAFVAIHVGNMLDRYFLASFNEKLNQFSLSYIQTYKKGDLTERLSDAMKLKTFFLRIFSRLLVDTFVALYSLAILLYIDWKLALLICGVVLIFYGWFKLTTPYLQSNERKRFIRKADFISKMMEKIDGIQVVKCFRLEGILSTKILNQIQELITIQTKTRYIDLINNGVVSLITTSTYTVLVILLARNAIMTQTLSLGQLISFIILSERVFGALSRLLEENLTLQGNEVILRRYFDFEDINLAKQSPTAISNFTIEEISLRKLYFGYSPANPILKEVDLTFKKGDKIRIEGSNGSGKSSLSKVLSFLYTYHGGEILINGLKSMFFQRDALKRKILLVSNEDLLFNETIEFNLAFGKEISPVRLVHLAKKVGLYEFISQNEEGLDFIINENGKNLSTGQRKKILIMRALLSEAEIIIMDEVLSGIDVDSRQQIETLINSLTDRTFILISHEPIHGITFDKHFSLTNGELICS